MVCNRAPPHLRVVEDAARRSGRSDYTCNVYVYVYIYICFNLFVYMYSSYSYIHTMFVYIYIYVLGRRGNRAIRLLLEIMRRCSIEKGKATKYDKLMI